MTAETNSLHNPKMLNPIKEYLDKKVRLDPYEWVNHMRENEPVRYDENRDGWNFFLYEDVVEILSNPTTFSSRRYPPQLLISQSALFQDPPRHTQLRNLVSKAFTPKMIQDLAPRIQEIVDELLDEASEQGGTQMDIVTAIGNPLPTTVIAEMLGVAAGDRKMFRHWASSWLKGTDSTDPEAVKRLLAEQKEAQEQLIAYLKEQLDWRRQHPQTDMLSALIEAEIDGQRLSEAELLAFCSLLLGAGIETTTNMISNSMRCFIEMPELQQQLHERPGLFPPAIKEVFRYRPVTPLLNRVAAEDVEFNGHQIRRGQGIIAWVSSANRDPRKFANPEQFIINRNPNPHLTFGLNIHYCLGAPLGRFEVLTALQGLFKRFRDFEYVPGVELQPVTSHLTNGVVELPVLCKHR